MEYWSTTGNSHRYLILYTLDSASNYSAFQKLKPQIADSGYSHELRRLVCFLFLKQGT
jgi:hypothetical protein